MITITHRKKEEGIEVSIGDNEHGCGIKILVKNEDLANSENGLEEIFTLATNYLNANYTSMHKKKVRYNSADPAQVKNITN